MTINLDELSKAVAILRSFVEHDNFTVTSAECEAIETAADQVPALIDECRRLREALRVSDLYDRGDLAIAACGLKMENERLKAGKFTDDEIDQLPIVLMDRMVVALNRGAKKSDVASESSESLKPQN